MKLLELLEPVLRFVYSIKFSERSAMPMIPIDWASVNWLYVILLALFVFLSTLIGTVISFRRAFLGALLSAVLFAGVFIFWTYYPHGLPLPISANGQKTVTPVQAASPPAPAAPAVPAQPNNPVRTISPPPADAQ
jgi:hypothetical protein